MAALTRANDSENVFVLWFCEAKGCFVCPPGLPSETGETPWQDGKLALSLLVTGVFANDVDPASTADHFAFVANSLNAGSYLHDSLLPNLGRWGSGTVYPRTFYAGKGVNMKNVGFRRVKPTTALDLRTSAGLFVH